MTQNVFDAVGIPARCNDCTYFIRMSRGECIQIMTNISLVWYVLKFLTEDWVRTFKIYATTNIH